MFGSGWMNQQQISRNSLAVGDLGQHQKLIKIGQITIGMKKDFLCELKLEENSEDGLDKEAKANLVKVELVITKDTQSKGSKVVKSESHFGSVQLIPKALAHKSEFKIEENQEVATQFLRVQGAHVMKEARNFICQDKLDEARQIFHSFQASLSNVKKLDVILDNLRTDVGRAQEFLHKPVPV